MPTLRWKFRYAWRLRYVLKLPFGQCWQRAGGALANVHHDLTACPLAAAESEYHAQASECLGVYAAD